MADWRGLCEDICVMILTKDKRLMVKAVDIAILNVNKLNDKEKTSPKLIQDRYYKSTWKDLCIGLKNAVDTKDKKGIKNIIEEMMTKRQHMHGPKGCYVQQSERMKRINKMRKKSG